jgi:hypothetical protein
MKWALVLGAVCITLMAVPLGSDASGGGPPPGLTPYGKLVWNLDALVRDFYGGAHACMRVPRFAIHRCRSPSFNDGDYRVTFANARRSQFRPFPRTTNPLRAVNAVPVTIDGRYISCDSSSWLAVTNTPAGWGEPVFCVRP